MEHHQVKILVISLAGIGDTLFATPLLKKLRQLYPGAVIDVLVMWPSAKSVLQNNPYINKVIQYNFLKEGVFKSLAFCWKLRGSYDVSINSYPQSKLAYRVVSFIIGAKKRISHVYGNSSFLDKMLISESVPHSYEIHAIQNNLNLIKLLDKKAPTAEPYELFLSTKNKNYADAFIKKNNLNAKDLVGISIGTSNTKNLALRRWPTDYYIELIKKILKNHKNSAVLLFGGPEEMKDNELIKEKIGDSRLFVIKTEDLMDSAALVGRSNVFLSVDNVMMHIAAALRVKGQLLINTPTVNKTVLPYRKDFVIVGGKIPSSIGYRYDGKGIYGSREDILKYMRSITVDTVYTKLKRFLT